MCHVPHFDFVAMSALPSSGAGCLVPLSFVHSSLSLLSSKGTVIPLVGNACMFLCLVIAIFGARDSWGGSFCNIFFDLWWSGGFSGPGNRYSLVTGSRIPQLSLLLVFSLMIQQLSDVKYDASLVRNHTNYQ